jgi:hypothetical protein
MKIRLLILSFLTTCCSSLEQNDLVEEDHLGKTTKGTIFYRIYQTGIDNYRYEFYCVNNNDTTDLFQTYLNDATYKGIRFIVQETRDTIKIKSTRDLGQLTKKIEDRVFIFQKKIDPFVNLGATAYGESGKVGQLMLYNDSISGLTDLEISIHRKVWNQEDVAAVTRDLKRNDIKAFTFIEKYPSSNADYYIVRLGQVSEEDLLTIARYRIDNKSSKIDKVVE